MQEVLRALADAVRAGDKAGRAQLMSLLLRLFFFEELPPEAMTALVPLFQARPPAAVPAAAAHAAAADEGRAARQAAARRLPPLPQPAPGLPARSRAAAADSTPARCPSWVQAQGKDVRTLRSLYYLAEVYCGPGAAGTPTLYDPALGALHAVAGLMFARHAGAAGPLLPAAQPWCWPLVLDAACQLHLLPTSRMHPSWSPPSLTTAAVGKRPDEKAPQAVLGEVWRLLQTPGLDPAAARASFFLAAAAARANPAVRKQLVAQVNGGLLLRLRRPSVAYFCLHLLLLPPLPAASV